jgi:hypothetical protein
MTYRCVATSVAGFVQQVAVAHVRHGYWFYVAGEIPAHKNPERVDRKLTAQYGIDVSKWTRARRKRAGLANVQYLRYGPFYVLLATHGQHPFFEAEAVRLKDVRQCPIRFQGYSIGLGRARGSGEAHVSVRMGQEAYREWKERLEGIALHRTVEELAAEFRTIPFEPYAPVREQLRCLLRAVNRRRKGASLELVPWAALRLHRRSIRPFG